ncbi:hypothetical protein [Longispora albida]|uniref:hypothetical protein n=1 Tax=Longispora albida TaxID=203523 RepID=UPI000380D9F4|nr:hypothetical protein [Longispora albida]
MNALIRMRLTGFVRGQRGLIAPAGILLLLAAIQAGEPGSAAEVYGLSAMLLFPVLAIQVKLLLDAEPDGQRGLAAVALGSHRREVTAGLAAAALTAGPVIAASLVLPWLVGGIRSSDLSPRSLVVGAWAHLIFVPAAVAIGAWASRAVTRAAGPGALLLAGAVVVTAVLDQRWSPVPWLVPPMLTVPRALNDNAGTGTLLVITAVALAWSAVTLGGYTWYRLRR